MKHVYSVEVYKSTSNQPGLRRLYMDRQEYERRTLTYDDISTAVENAATTQTELIPYVVEMGKLGTVTLYIKNAALLASGVTASSILTKLELLEPMLVPLSTMGDIVSELTLAKIHPIAKGIIGTLRAIHRVLKSVSELCTEINDLLQEMCSIFRYVNEINNVLGKMDTDLICETLTKLNELILRTCDFVKIWHAYVERKGIKGLRSEFVRLQDELKLGMAVDVYLRAPRLPQPTYGDSDSATAAFRTTVSVQHELNSRMTTPLVPTGELPNYSEALANGAGKAPYHAAVHTMSSLSICHYAQHNYSRPSFSRHQSSATLAR
ncbi:hypothetical protein CYLTODRAFT_443492 [Cylindrobasidium torrendii FP15055 ss-10]|uniref:Uncharacterized protein n=1 Tax=Cylindrobasidium torrendii FP15055 ss-10 TaxID=1314674 RepID=A0A0D7BDK5_9AGAR|nr:hypothetical protein CYLTODRAFT_443492 [Cylindrobasidium torrendii FP15055 ss-10]